jgi:ABC-type nitrate/sulfonate/bicarbonate transport system substrate-binding protein
MTRRTGPLVAALCLATVVGGSGCGEKRDTQTLPATPTGVTVALDGGAPPDASLAPLYAAIAGGDFTRAGLTVTPAAQPAGTALASLTAGRADIAVVSEPALLTARDHGASLVAVAVLVRSPLDALISIAPHPITKLTMLDGATVAAPQTPLATAELDTVLRGAGVAPTAVKRVDAGTDPTRPLLARTAVASLGSWNADAVRLVHHQPDVIKVDDVGVPTYSGYVLAVRLDEARNRGPLLRTFLQALTDGFKTTLAMPAPAADQLAAANPGLRRSVARAELKATLPVMGPTGPTVPYGYADAREWQTFGKWMLAQGLLTQPGDTARAVTDEFLPGQGE